MTSIFTDSLEVIGKGISDFLRALLKDMPVHLQIPVLVMITFIVVSIKANIFYDIFR